MKIIFLDIDGVITSARTGWFNWDIHTVNFLRWVCQQTGAKIVISSTWRYNHNKQFFESIFEEFLHDDHQTPDVKRTKMTQHVSRGVEIQAWLDKHPETEFYIIIDDDSDVLEHQKPFFVQTEGENGLSFENMMVVRGFLLIEDFFKEETELFQHPNMFAFHRRRNKA